MHTHMSDGPGRTEPGGSTRRASLNAVSGTFSLGAVGGLDFPSLSFVIYTMGIIRLYRVGLFDVQFMKQPFPDALKLCSVTNHLQGRRACRLSSLELCDREQIHSSH